MKTFTPSVAFLGDLTADVYVEKKLVKLGGAALNCAMWAKRIGMTPSVFSAVGDGSVGRQFIKKMQSEGIDTSFVDILPGSTSTIEIRVNNSGERQYGIWKPGVLSAYHIDTGRAKEIACLDAICATVYPPYIHVLSELHAVLSYPHNDNKPFVVVNFGDMKEFHNDSKEVIDALSVADMVMFGLDSDTDETLINELRRSVPPSKMLVITLGQYGSIAYYKGKTYIEPPLLVSVKDTTGAGDAFLVAFINCYLKTKDVQKSLNKGTILASQIIQKIGAY